MERERTLRRAETLLRQGLLDEAIAQYVRLAEDRPDDWAVLKGLGDLYLRARRPELAVEQFGRIADHFEAIGSPSRALAVYTRILKLTPRSEHARLRAAGQLRAIADGEVAAGRATDALATLRRALDYDPSDTETRLRIVRGSIEAGDLAAARTCLSGQVETPALLLYLLKIELLEGNGDAVRAIATRALREAPANVAEVVRLGQEFAERCGPAAFECIDAAVDRAVADQDWAAGTSALKEFGSRVPDHVPALMRLVELCVDGGLDADLPRAQQQLADAYLLTGRAREARVIAEDLALREPWERDNIERFRRALTMLGEPDPDIVIADCLCGDSPFDLMDQALAGDRPRPAADAAASSSIAAERGPIPAPGEEGRTPPDTHATPALAALAVSVEQQAALALLAEGRRAEAVAVLKKAVRSPKHRFQSATLLARLQEEAGELHEAIEWFERATQAAPARGAAHDVLYDLGRVLLAAGEADRALAVFLELRAEVPTYRDVSWQIACLRRDRDEVNPTVRAAG